jgi:hypothetical protein
MGALSIIPCPAHARQIGLDTPLDGRGNLVTSSAGPNMFSGLNVNSLVGANNFYLNGYDGTGTVIANIEGGLIWGAHDTMGGTLAGGAITGGQVTQYIYGGTAASGSLNGTVSSSVASNNALIDRHATWVGSALSGTPSVGGGEYQRGIAYGADLWSGAVGTSFNGITNGQYNTSFSLTYQSFAFAYKTAMQTGIDGRRADVVNSSWGFSDPTGYNIVSVAVDGLAYANPYTTVVAAAGNSGPSINTVDGIAAGFNTISVGATGSDTSSPPYSHVSTFSGRSPTDYLGPDGSAPGARARVDILAPGEALTLALYGGTTGGNKGGFDATGGASNFYTGGLAGTSYAAPIVAGGATLLVDAGYDLYGTNANARDARVIKAVLLNSADKLTGWSNGSLLSGSTLLTTQALDYAQGAGQMNLAQAFSQYTAGDADLLLNAGQQATIDTIGWDFGQVARDTAIPLGRSDYYFNRAFVANETLTATLNWFVADTYSDNPNALSLNRFDNLYLELYRVTGGVPGTLVASSAANFITTQHLFFGISDPGEYMLRVQYAGARYDSAALTSQTVQYGLAYAVASAPEPSSLALLFFVPGGVGLIRIAAVRRRRRRDTV